MTAYSKDQTFNITQPRQLNNISGYVRTLIVGEQAKITAVFNHGQTIQFRTKTLEYGVPKTMSFKVRLDIFAELVGGELPRKLGVRPSDDLIDPLDPRLDWLWRDVAEYADRSHYCSEFNRIMRELGLPGREKEFMVERQIGIYKAAIKVVARSQKEAESKVPNAIA